jgi:nitroreductase
MDVIDAIHSRRSVRSYLPRPVSRELIEAIIWDAAQAPPPRSGQVPWTFHVFEGVERIAGLGTRAKQFAKDHHPDEPGWDWTQRADFKVFWDAPVLVIICGRIEDCCRAGTILMLSAHARGLGTCWVGAPMLWLRDAEVRKELGVVAEPVSALCLGYAKEIPVPAPRARPLVKWG